MAELLGWDGATLAPVPGVTVPGDVPLVLVGDADSDRLLGVPVAEAGHGMLRAAERLQAGSVHRAEAERQAIELLELAGEWPPSKRKRGRRG